MKTILLLVVGTAVALTQPVIAGAIHQLSITENSSTSLTATYDGSPLTVTVFGFPEAWTISLPPSFVPSTFLQQWSEPENSTLVNSVNFGSSLFFVLIKSDRQFTDTFALNGDGATVIQMRHRFQEAMRDDLIALVETETKRKVVAFMSTNHIDPDMAAELFVLEPLADVQETPDLHASV